MKSLLLFTALLLGTFGFAQNVVTITVPLADTPFYRIEESNFETLNELFITPIESAIYRFDIQYPGNVSILIGEHTNCQLTVPANIGSGVKDFHIKKGTDIRYLITTENEQVSVSAECSEIASEELKVINLRYNDETFTLDKNKPISAENEKAPPVPPATPIFITTAIRDQIVDASSPVVGTPISFPSYHFVYDHQNSFYELFKMKDSTNKKMIKHPRVGSIVHVEVINYNPYRDSFRIQRNFEDFFADAESNFNKSINALTGNASSSGTDTTTEETDGARGPTLPKADEEIAKNFISTFHLEVSSLYEFLYLQKTISPTALDEVLLLLDRNIIQSFEIPLATTAYIESEGRKFIQSINESERARYTNLLMSGIEYFKKLHNYHRLQFQSIPIESKDLTKISIDIMRDNRWGDDPLTLSLQNKGGWGFGYSVGFMYSGLRDFKYDLKRVSTINETMKFDSLKMENILQKDTVFSDSIIRVDNGDFNIGLLALGHVYTRLPGVANVGFSVGFGFNGQLEDHYFVGGSLMLGRKRQLVFSSGIVFGKVDRLAAPYTEGELLPVTTERVNSVANPRQVWEKGIFAAVSFQL